MRVSPVLEPAVPLQRLVRRVTRRELRRVGMILGLPIKRVFGSLVASFRSEETLMPSDPPGNIGPFELPRERMATQAICGLGLGVISHVADD